MTKHRRILCGFALLAALTSQGAYAQTTAADVVVMRRAVAPPRPRATTPATPAVTRPLSCGAFQAGYFTGWSNRRFLGNSATLAAGQDLCETAGRSPENGCTVAKISDGTWNAFTEANSVKTATVTPNVYMAFCTAR